MVVLGGKALIKEVRDDLNSLLRPKFIKICLYTKL